MRPSVSAAVALLVLVASSANAGQTYRYALAVSGDTRVSGWAGSVYSDGARYRVTPDPVDGVPRTITIRLSDEQPILSLDPLDKVYYWSKVAAKDIEPSLPLHDVLSLPLPPGPLRVKDERVDCGEVIASNDGVHQTATVSMHFEYTLEQDLGSEIVRAEFAGDEIVTSIPEWSWVVPPPLAPRLAVKVESIDRPARACLSKVRGFPVKIEIRGTRKIKGGASDSATMRVTVTDFNSAAPTQPEAFEIPSGFQFREPVMSVPFKQ